MLSESESAVEVVSDTRGHWRRIASVQSGEQRVTDWRSDWDRAARKNGMDWRLARVEARRQAGRRAGGRSATATLRLRVTCAPVPVYSALDLRMRRGAKCRVSFDVAPPPPPLLCVRLVVPSITHASASDGAANTC